MEWAVVWLPRRVTWAFEKDASLDQRWRAGEVSA